MEAIACHVILLGEATSSEVHKRLQQSLSIMLALIKRIPIDKCPSLLQGGELAKPIKRHQRGMEKGWLEGKGMLALS